MSWPYYTDNSWQRKKVLKYRQGDEKSETLVLYSSCVTPNADARRLVDAGTVLCEITSGAGLGKYGPYEKTASDGRETVDLTNQAFVLLTGKDVTLGDQAVEGLFADCVFYRPTINEVNAISNSAAMLTALRTAFPQCNFRS